MISDSVWRGSDGTDDREPAVGIVLRCAPGEPSTAAYNEQQRHSGLAMVTPADVHAGRAADRWQQRKQTLLAAYERHPERFVWGEPSPRQVPEEVWINKPKHLAAAR